MRLLLRTREFFAFVWRHNGCGRISVRTAWALSGIWYGRSSDDA